MLDVNACILRNDTPSHHHFAQRIEYFKLSYLMKVIALESNMG